MNSDCEEYKSALLPLPPCGNGGASQLGCNDCDAPSVVDAVSCDRLGVIGWCLLFAGVPLLLSFVTCGVWLGVIGLGFSLRCRGEVGAGMGTVGRPTPSPVCDGASLELFCTFACLFFPPMPADTSARTLSGSPFSLLAAFEPESVTALSSVPSCEVVLTFVLVL